MVKRQTEFYVVLVEPKFSGNIGAVARVMMNFDVAQLFLVNPCALDNQCYARAMHADAILDAAQVFASFEDVLKNLDYLVATSSIASMSEKKHLRNPLSVEEFTTSVYDMSGKVGLVFGREDYGLLNPEIAQCDVMVQIPTSESYPSLNLSHAVGVLLYALYVKRNDTSREVRRIGTVEKKKLYEFFSILLDEITYPEHKKENTQIMFQRLLGRAMPSTWEYHTLMGVLSRTIEQMKKNTPKKR